MNVPPHSILVTTMLHAQTWTEAFLAAAMLDTVDLEYHVLMWTNAHWEQTTATTMPNVPTTLDRTHAAAMLDTLEMG